MLYTEFMIKVKNLAIAIDDTTNKAYIIPDYRYLMSKADLKTSDVEDFDGLNDDIVSESLKLEVKAYNAMHDAGAYVSNMLKDIIDYAALPLNEEQNNELIKNVLEYVKASQKKQEQKSDIMNKVGTPMSFSKKKI